MILYLDLFVQFAGKRHLVLLRGSSQNRGQVQRYRLGGQVHRGHEGEPKHGQRY